MLSLDDQLRLLKNAYWPGRRELRCNQYITECEYVNYTKSWVLHATRAGRGGYVTVKWPQELKTYKAGVAVGLLYKGWRQLKDEISLREEVWHSGG